MIEVIGFSIVMIQRGFFANCSCIFKNRIARFYRLRETRCNYLLFRVCYLPCKNKLSKPAINGCNQRYAERGMIVRSHFESQPFLLRWISYHCQASCNTSGGDCNPRISQA